MKITLERPELIHILSKSLGYPISDEDVTIQHDPFEVSISNVSLTGPGSLPEAEPPAAEPPTEVEVEQAPQDNPLSIEDLLSKNHAYGGPKLGEKEVKDPDRVQRPLGPLETEDPPPVTQEELRAVLRGYDG